MRQQDGITGSMDMNLGKLLEMVRDKVSKSQTRLERLNNNTITQGVYIRMQFRGYLRCPPKVLSQSPRKPKHQSMGITPHSYRHCQLGKVWEVRPEASPTGLPIMVSLTLNLAEEGSSVQSKHNQLPALPSWLDSIFQHFSFFLHLHEPCGNYS